ncbi:MAG: VWA domain-containing protein [Bryobacteraceae bacterium]|jgi:VWFA-related protein
MLLRLLPGTVLGLSLVAQAPPPPNPPIRVQVNEVIVPVTVTDDKGRFVSDLEKKDFQIFDEGKEQKIEYFSRERNQPVVIGFLIDLSSASAIHWKNYQDGAIELVYTLLPGDKKFSGYLLSYSTAAELVVNTTNDPEKLTEKIRKMRPSGGSSLFDAVWMACTRHELVKGEPIEPRRILVIIGDGHDNASSKTLEQALEIAQRNLVTIYGVSTSAFGEVQPEEQNLVKLAEQTGGRVVSPLQKVYSDISGWLSTPKDAGNYVFEAETGGYASELSKGLYTAIANVAGEVTTQYILRYVPDTTGAPTDPKRAARRIKVTVDLPEVKVRARREYYPNNP